MVLLSTVIRDLATTVAGNLTSSKTKAPSCRLSEAAANLLNSEMITVNMWSKYPKPPQAFLDREWNADDTMLLPQALGGLHRLSPCILSEHSSSTRIVIPLLSAFINCLFRTYGIEPVELGKHLLVECQLRTGATTADATFCGAERTEEERREYTEFTWVAREDETKATMEMKPPLSANSGEMTTGLDALVGQPLSKEGSSASKMLGQVVELCHKSQLRFSALITAPLTIRPVYLEPTMLGQSCRAFLAPNLMHPKDIYSVYDKDQWEDFFGRLFWIAFCIWVMSMDAAKAAVAASGDWDAWKDTIEQTLRPAL